MNKHLLHELISAHAAADHGAVAVSSDQYALTYGQLEAYSAQLATMLSVLPLHTGQTAGIYMHASPAYITALLAVFRAGGVALPLDAQYPAQRISLYVEEAKPALLITVPELYDACMQSCAMIDGVPVWILHLDENGLRVRDASGKEAFMPAEAIAPVLDGNNNNYLLFTSGSTGTPKGILGRHKSLSHFIHWEMSEFNLNASSRIPLLAPIGFDVSLRDIFAPLCAGGTLYIPGDKKQQPEHFLQWIAKNHITLMHCVPSFLRLLIVAAEETPSLNTCLQELKYMLVAGEPLYGKDINAFRAAFGHNIQLVNVYGPSETTLAKIFYRVPGKNFVADEIVPLGNPLPNTAVLVIGDNQLCAAGVPGEIMIKTPFMTGGYVNNDTEQQEKFIQNPLHNNFEDIVFRTGDTGYYDSEGLVRFSHRADDMVKINGNRVEPGEVQKTALLHPSVRQAVALVMEENGVPAYLSLYYTAHDEIPVQVLSDHMGQYLPLYMHPSRYIRVEKIPLTPNGKTDTAALKAIQPAVMEPPVLNAPADETMQLITDTWKAVLKNDAEPGDQSFFHAGGSSLKAIQMIARLYKQKGVLLTLKEMMAQPTVSGIRKLLLEKSGQKNVAEEKIQTPLPALSTTQKSILQWALTDRQWADFNVPYAYRITGDIDTGKLIEAIQEVSSSYPFFNRRIIKKDDQWKEISVPHEAVPVKLETSMQIAPPVLHEQLQQSAVELFSKDSMRPIRFHIIQTANDECYLLAVTHLAMADGATMHLIFSEIMKAYAALQQNQAYERNTKLLQQDEPRTAEAQSAHAEWWKQQQEQLHANDWLPQAATFNSEHLVERAFTVALKQVNALQQRAAEWSTPLNTLLLAVFEETISMLSQRSACSYHNVTSNRFRFDNDITANLLYYVPVNIAAGKKSLWSSLPSVKNRLADIIDHLPMVLPGDMSAPRPVIVLNMAEMPVLPGTSSQEQAITIEPYMYTIHRERFPVNVSFLTGDEGLHVTVTHDAGLGSFGLSFEQVMKQSINQLLTTETIS